MDANNEITQIKSAKGRCSRFFHQLYLHASAVAIFAFIRANEVVTPAPARSHTSSHIE